NSYTQVNPTNVTLTLTNSCTLTWAWTTNYWLAANTTAGGSINVTSAWYSAGSSAVITAAASNLWVFTGWSGATNGCSIAGNVITSPMTNARSITANFFWPSPVVDNSTGAVSQTASSAALQGVLTQGYSANTWFCWGTSDGGANSTSAWQNVIPIGTVTQNMVFTTNVTGLATNVTYWYRCYAMNANGTAWSSSRAFSGSSSMGSWTLWSPTQVSNAGLWLDADDASTVLSNGGSVSNWLDKSGHSRHASQAAATNQPTDTADGLNGKHVLRFDGATDFLNVDLDFLAGVSHAAFIVAKVSAYRCIYGAATGNMSTNSLFVGFYNASTYRMSTWGGDWNGAISNNFKAGQGNLLNYVWKVGTSKEIFANGSSEGTNGTAGPIGPMAGGGRISNPAGLGYFGGDI
ncbi:MAG TPA: hypothetical protein DCS43_09460, partial [Verrucomicrobia bacterium]|nr:hypothetical protein [Verrucomicrobiota bacterium]